MFKYSQEHKEILKECKDILEDEAEFSCFVDGMWEYHLEKENIKYLFFIIADDDFIRKMSVEWLIDLKRVSYFSSEICIKSGGETIDSYSKTFSVLEKVSKN